MLPWFHQLDPRPRTHVLVHPHSQLGRAFQSHLSLEGPLHSPRYPSQSGPCPLVHGLETGSQSKWLVQGCRVDGGAELIADFPGLGWAGGASTPGSDLGATEAPTPPLSWAGVQAGGNEIFPETGPSWHIQSQVTQRGHASGLS